MCSSGTCQIVGNVVVADRGDILSWGLVLDAVSFAWNIGFGPGGAVGTP